METPDFFNCETNNVFDEFEKYYSAFSTHQINQLLSDHNYASVESSSHNPHDHINFGSLNPTTFMNPNPVMLSDDLAFVDDLVPISTSQEGSSASLSSSMDSIPVAVQPPADRYDPLPDLTALVDKDTLMEALCLVDMPQQRTEFDHFNPAVISENGGAQSLVSTLLDLFTSGPHFSTRSRRSLLPRYVSEADSGEESAGDTDSSADLNSIHNFRNRPKSIDRKDSDIDIVTDEERVLMAREGVFLPTPSHADEAIVLTEEQERVLKNVRRKMRNKESAKESRKRKADYIENLEKKVKIESQASTKLKSRVQELEQENEALSARLQYMQNFVQKLVSGMQKTPHSRDTQPTQKSTCIFVMLFALCLVVAPRNGLFSLPTEANSPDFDASQRNFNAAIAATPDGLEAALPLAAYANNDGPSLLPMRQRLQSFVFTYEPSTVADRAVDL